MNGWVVLILLCGIVWMALPRIGLLAFYRTWRATRERELVEDALKYLLNREHQGRHATPESLSGALALPRARSMRLIEKMEAQGLLETRGAELHLTPEGERWALHVVRAHRLWERYLADEARMPLARVHDEAQRREHTLTAAQLDELEAAMGYPPGAIRTATRSRPVRGHCPMWQELRLLPGRSTRRDASCIWRTNRRLHMRRFWRLVCAWGRLCGCWNGRRSAWC